MWLLVFSSHPCRQPSRVPSRLPSRVDPPSSTKLLPGGRQQPRREWSGWDGRHPSRLSSGSARRTSTTPVARTTPAAVSRRSANDRHANGHCLRVHFEVKICLASFFSLHSSFCTQHSIQRHTSRLQNPSPCSLSLSRGLPVPPCASACQGGRACAASGQVTYTRSEPSPCCPREP